MKILVAGPEFAGKSVFLEKYSEYATLRKLFCKCLDCDNHRAQMPLPEEFELDMDYLIEDQHAFGGKRFYPLSLYDKIYYLFPSWLTHLRFWLRGMWTWFKRGKFGIDPDTALSDGWRGTSIPYDTANIRPILKEFWKKFRSRKFERFFDVYSIRIGFDLDTPIVRVYPKIRRGKIVFYFKDEDEKMVI